MMKDDNKKYLYISGVLLIITLSSMGYVARTYQVLGKQIFENFNGQVFLVGTILFAVATIILFCLYLRTKTKK